MKSTTLTQSDSPISVDRNIKIVDKRLSRLHTDLCTHLDIFTLSYKSIASAHVLIFILDFKIKKKI